MKEIRGQIPFQCAMASIILRQFLEEALKSGYDWGFYCPLLQENKRRDWIYERLSLGSKWPTTLLCLKSQSYLVSTVSLCRDMYQPLLWHIVGFCVQGQSPKQKHPTVTPLGFINNQKTESGTKVSTAHTARNNGITVACFFLGGTVNQRTRK